jgi:pimeloyl-ACP methyl ester carboxylesterase
MFCAGERPTALGHLCVSTGNHHVELLTFRAVDWADNARDMLNFLLHYLPPSSGTSDLPVNLPRLPPATASARQAGGISDRIVAGIGHSLGGCSMVLASFHAPALFSSLMLIDPVINPGGDRFVDLPFGGPYGAVKRRVRWSSRYESREAGLRSKLMSGVAPTRKRC